MSSKIKNPIEGETNTAVKKKKSKLKPLEIGGYIFAIALIAFLLFIVIPRKKFSSYLIIDSKAKVVLELERDLTIKSAFPLNEDGSKLLYGLGPLLENTHLNNTFDFLLKSARELSFTGKNETIKIDFLNYKKLQDDKIVAFLKTKQNITYTEYKEGSEKFFQEKFSTKDASYLLLEKAYPVSKEEVEAFNKNYDEALLHFLLIRKTTKISEIISLINEVKTQKKFTKKLKNKLLDKYKTKDEALTKLNEALNEKFLALESESFYLKLGLFDEKVKQSVPHLFEGYPLTDEEIDALKKVKIISIFYDDVSDAFKETLKIKLNLIKSNLNFNDAKLKLLILNDDYLELKGFLERI